MMGLIIFCSLPISAWVCFMIGYAMGYGKGREYGQEQSKREQRLDLMLSEKTMHGRKITAIIKQRISTLKQYQEKEI
jgi:hypothetical protein